MKRILLKLPYEYLNRRGFKDSMNYIKKLRVREILNFVPGSMTVLEEIKLNDASSKPEELIGKDGISYIEIIKENNKNDTYLCILKVDNPNCFCNYFSRYNIFVGHPILTIKDEVYIP
ncbi:MAG: hypothetical protein EU549_05060, partial [Promethearchaeota archaeon]